MLPFPFFCHVQPSICPSFKPTAMIMAEMCDEELANTYWHLIPQKWMVLICFNVLKPNVLNFVVWSVPFALLHF